MVSYLASHFCTPFAKYAATFFRQLASPLLALHSQARSLLISTDSLRKPSSPLGGGMIPAVPAHPVPHGLGRQIIRSSHRRDRPAPSPAISRTTPSPSEHHALDTVPSYPATRTPGPHCPKKTTHSTRRIIHPGSLRVGGGRRRGAARRTVGPPTAPVPGGPQGTSRGRRGQTGTRGASPPE